MKLWGIILLIVFLVENNSNRLVQENPLGFEVLLKPDSMGREKVYLKLSNRTERKLRINDPPYWINARPTLLLEGKEVPTLIKIRTDVSKSSEYVEILPNSEHLTEFSYGINELYDLKFNSSYELFFTYFGRALDAEGKIITTENLTSVMLSLN